MGATLKDEDNPVYALQTISEKVLIEAATGKIDLNQLAQDELRQRGLNNNGSQIKKYPGPYFVTLASHRLNRPYWEGLR